MINDGKLAVVLGIEASELFGCTEYQDAPQCTLADVKAGLKVREPGVSSLYPVHKFDNAFGGTRFDAGAVGSVINGNSSRLKRPLLGGRGLPRNEADTIEPAGAPMSAAAAAGELDGATDAGLDRGRPLRPRRSLRRRRAASLRATAALQQARPHRPRPQADRAG